jgi:hypothetical protein
VNGTERPNGFVEMNRTEFVNTKEAVGMGVEVTVASIVEVTVAASVGMGEGDGEGIGDDDCVGDCDGELTPEQPKVTIA